MTNFYWWFSFVSKEYLKRGANTFVVLELCDTGRQVSLQFVKEAILGQPSALPQWWWENCKYIYRLCLNHLCMASGFKSNFLASFFNFLRTDFGIYFVWNKRQMKTMKIKKWKWKKKKTHFDNSSTFLSSCCIILFHCIIIICYSNIVVIVIVVRCNVIIVARIRNRNFRSIRVLRS